MSQKTGPFSRSQVAEIAAALGVEKEVDLEQLRIGMEVELEHGRSDPLTNVTDDDPVVTAKIALAHLREKHDYYRRLAAMEADHEQVLVVGDVMTRELLTVREDQPLTIADRLLRARGVSGVPVVERDGRLVGVLSRTDLIGLAGDDPDSGWHGRGVRSAMTSPAITISPDASLQEAAARMEEHRVHRLVVVQDDGRPVGILSTMDLVRSVAGSGHRPDQT